MKYFFVIMLAVMLSVVGGCIFSMNDDYDKSFTPGGGGGDGEYTVSGTIVDISGAGVSGVDIELVGVAIETTTTDENGAYEFENVAGGSYVVRPPTSKYAPMQITVSEQDYFVGTVRSGGHGGNKDGDYSCSLCH